MGGGARRSVAESLATQVLTRVPSLTDRLVRTVQQGNPGYRGADAVPRKDCGGHVTTT